MIEIQCPRCLQYWYLDEGERVRGKLCPGCRDKRPRKRTTGGGIQLGVFALVAGALLLVDGAWITLSALWFDPFGPAMAIYGGILLFPCAVWLSAVFRMYRWGGGGEFDWNIHRWPLLIGLMGLACVLAFFSLRHSP